jgi:glycosyltransferase involved in cell wall biosynthesis
MLGNDPNHIKFIDSAIGSLLSQTLEDFELIIIDDCSTDGSASAIKDWTTRDSRIKAQFNFKNEGISKTINHGIQMAAGKFVTILDSDQMLRSDALERMVDVFERDPECGVVIGEAAVIDERGELTGKTSSDLYGGRPKLQAGNFFDELIVHSFVVCGAFRRELISNYGIRFDEDLKLASDWIFWLDLAAVCSFFYIAEPISYYRVHPMNISRSSLGKSLYEKDFTMIPEKVFSKHSKLLDLTKRRALLAASSSICERSTDESVRQRGTLFRLMVTDIDELVSEIGRLRSELNDVRFRCESEIRVLRSETAQGNA